VTSVDKCPLMGLFASTSEDGYVKVRSACLEPNLNHCDLFSVIKPGQYWEIFNGIKPGQYWEIFNGTKPGQYWEIFNGIKPGQYWEIFNGIKPGQYWEIFNGILGLEMVVDTNYDMVVIVTYFLCITLGFERHFRQNSPYLDLEHTIQVCTG